MALEKSDPLKKLSTKMKLFLAGISFLLIITAAAFGNTLTVINHDDSGPGSLRDAIANAAPGDTIVFDLPASDTITLTSEGLVIDKDLTITGPGADQLTVARSSAGATPAFIVFDVMQGAVTINGLTISNGDGSMLPYGGGLHSQSSGHIVISGCTFTNNLGNMGGGFGTEGSGGVTLMFCTFTGNIAVMGGAIYCGGNVTISHSTITEG